MTIKYDQWRGVRVNYRRRIPDDLRGYGEVELEFKRRLHAIKAAGKLTDEMNAEELVAAYAIADREVRSENNDDEKPFEEIGNQRRAKNFAFPQDLSLSGAKRLN